MEAPTSDNTLQYQLTKEETVTQLWKMVVRPKTLVLLALAGLCGIVILTVRTDKPLWAWGFIVFPVVFLLAYRRVLHKLVAQHPEFLEVQTLSFNADSITISNSVTTMKWPWSRLRKMTTSDEFCILRFDTLGSGAVIPLRALSKQQKADLLSHASVATAVQ